MTADKSKRAAGLQLNMGKCGILLPPNSPRPPNGSLPPGVKINTDGIRLAGAPIGTDDFCKQFVRNQVTDATSRLDKLAVFNPQAVIDMIQLCIIPVPRTSHPTGTHPRRV